MKSTPRAVQKWVAKASIMFLLFSFISPQLSLFKVPSASAVTNVLGDDIDTTGPNLDGRDFRIRWTPDNTTPAGYTSTRVYVVPNALSITAGNVTTNGCGGNPCADVGFFNNYSQSSHMLPQFRTADSANTPWNAATAYKTCVLTQATSSVLDCSGSFNVASDTVADTSPPFIDHMPANTVITGQAGVFHALIKDDQTQNPTSRLNHGNNFSTQVNAAAVAQAQGLSTFTTAGNITGQTFAYYLQSQDGAPTPNQIFFGNMPGLTANNVNSNAINAQVVSAGSNSISGTIRSGGQAVQDAYVFLGGLAVAGVLTNAQGQYTFSNVPAGGYEITAMRTGFCAAKRFETVTGNKTNIDLNVNAGECTFNFGGGGGGGGGGAPFSIFSGPPRGGMAAPNEKIRVGFNVALNAQTVNDNQSNATTDNVYLINNGTGNPVEGRVTYCANNQAAGCTSSLFQMDTNVILFEPITNGNPVDLASGGYTLVITDRVTSESGQAVQGTRPGGGDEINFNVGQNFSNNQISTAFTQQGGPSGAFMPPFVQDFSAQGAPIRPNSRIILGFNQAMNSASLTTDNIRLVNSAGAPQTITLSVDNNTRKSVTITPSANLAVGSYEIRVLGAAASQGGMTMRPPADAAQPAFVGPFQVQGAVDSTPPTIFPANSSGATGVPVGQGCIEFGFNESMNPGTLTSSNVTLARGSTSTTATVNYFPGENKLCLTPSAALAPNTNYTVTFGTSVADLAANALSAAQTFTFTTGAVDTVGPNLIQPDCQFDEANGRIRFTESMIRDTAAGSGFAGSVINPVNLTLTQQGNNTDRIDANTTLTYDPADNAVVVSGLSQVISGQPFTLTIANVTDVSGNALVTAGSANICNGIFKDSRQTFGDFGGGGNIPPPVFSDGQGGFGSSGGQGGAGGQFTMGDFGNFKPTDVISGNVPRAFPFNNTAGANANVFHIELPSSVLGRALANGNQIVLTFPSGTNVSGAKQDTHSPFGRDMNQAGTGIVTFDNTFDSDGIRVDTNARTVTIQLAVTGGSPGANDFNTIDLAGIINGPIPKTNNEIGIKLLQSGVVAATATTLPYPTMQGGSNSITVNVCAGSCSTPANVSGTVYLFGGGPAGPLNKTLTLTNGVISAVDGTSASNVSLTGLNDGCYGIGTEPTVTLGGTDYFGKDFPEPICVNSGNPNATQNIVLTSSAASGASVPVTVVITNSAGFSNVSADIFAGGPGRFVKKTVTLNGISTTATINLPSNGFWHVGMGPAMSKGPSAGRPDFDAFGGMPPSPVGLEVTGLPATGAVRQGFGNFGGAGGGTFNDANDTLTFAIRGSSIQVPVTVKDGADAGLANVEVFMHQQGFGSGAFGTTTNSGTVTLKVADYGPYEIGAFIPGVGEVHKFIDIRNVSNTTKIFVEGTEVSTVDLKIQKDAFTISGKVLDANNNAIANAPLAISDTTGKFRPGRTEKDGTYSASVSAGTWTITAQLPPSQTEACGTFSTTVTITTESKSGQNITNTNTSCSTLTVTVTVGGVVQANKMLFIEAWDSANNRPTGGFHRNATTNSSGVATVKLANGTYLVGMHDPNTGELSEVVTVSGNTNLPLSSGTTGTITFTFTGGTSAMNGFLEVKGVKDTATSKIRFGKAFKDASQPLTISVKAGNYTYSADIFGVGRFIGNAATGATTAVALGSSSLVTLSGRVFDSSNNPLANATVTAQNTSTGSDTFSQTDANGYYSLSVAPAASTSLRVDRAGYVWPTASKTISLTQSDPSYDFGGSAFDESALTLADKTIKGIVFKSNGSTPATDGFVYATNTAGEVVTAPIDPTNGYYTLNVPPDAGWTIRASASLSAESKRDGTVNTSDAGTDIDKHITLTADATRIPASANTSIGMSTGGTFDNSATTGIKMTAPAGALGTGSGEATMTFEKGFEAPATNTYAPVNNVSYDVSAKDSSNQSIKDTASSVELTFDYDPAKLPSGVGETDLAATYFSSEANEWRKCEGGSTVDVDNNKITCVTTHFTTFAVSYPPSKVSADNGGSGRPRDEQQATSGGGGGGTTPATPSLDTLNSTTGALSTQLSVAATRETVIERPLTIAPSLIITDPATRMRTAQLTGEGGSLTVRPNAGATVSFDVPAGTSVTGNADWNGNITPPLIRPRSIVATVGEPIVGSTDTLTQEEVNTVINVGSSTSSLTFSRPVQLHVPTTGLANGALVQLYSSTDGNTWTLMEGTFTVINGSVTFSTTHFTYFAVAATGKVDASAAAQAAQMSAKADASAEGKMTAEKPVPFTDTVSHWSKDFVAKLYAMGVVNGKSATSFSPDAPITRAEITKIALNAFGYKVAAEAGAKAFNDVETSAWYAPYIQLAKKEKIVGGYTDGTFRPDQPVTRAEALKILFGAAKVSVDARGVFLFKDTAETSWYMKFVAYAKNNDIVAGYPDGTFRPGASITRAEVAKIAVKVMDMKK